MCSQVASFHRKQVALCSLSENGLPTGNNMILSPIYNCRFLSIFTLLSIWHSARHHPHIFILSVPRHALGHSLRHSKYFSRKGYLSVAFGASQSFLTSRFLSAWHRRIPLLWRSSGTKLFCKFFVANLRQSIFGWREPKEFKKRHLSP